LERERHLREAEVTTRLDSRQNLAMDTALRRPLFVSGFMATGKSTVGRRVAEALGVGFEDTDALLTARTGKSPGELFREEGEARFREREAELLATLLRDPTPRVVALGGGTVTMARIRHALLDAGTVVTLRARAATLVARIPSLAERPNLLSSSPVGRAEDLLQLRREAYAECHAAVDTDDRTIEEVTAAVGAIARRDLLAMPLGMRSYVVEATDDAPERLAGVLDELAPSSVLAITDRNVAAARRPWLDAATSGPRPWHLTEIVPGEPSKTLATVSSLWDEALTSGVDRDAVVVAFGGGVVGDLAGFVAATVLRGVRCVQVPTSLLAMVDSSVGGKTGFDHARGKNLIGAFFQPARVLVDVAHLETLPPRERAAGLAEVVKIALVRDAALLADLETHAEALAAGDRGALRLVVRRAIADKIAVVREDELEAGVRALLNLGHTVGHALETHAQYTHLLHGEGVALGTVHELEAAERLGLTPQGTAARAAALLGRLGLPTRAAKGDLEAAWPHVLSDKKRASQTLRLPVVTDIGHGVVTTVTLDALRDALLR